MSEIAALSLLLACYVGIITMMVRPGRRLRLPGRGERRARRVGALSGIASTGLLVTRLHQVTELAVVVLLIPIAFGVLCLGWIVHRAAQRRRTGLLRREQTL